MKIKKRSYFPLREEELSFITGLDQNIIHQVFQPKMVHLLSEMEKQNPDSIKSHFSIRNIWQYV
jgi:hypothetical protein